MRMKTAHQPYLMFNLDKPRSSVLAEPNKYNFISALGHHPLPPGQSFPHWEKLEVYGVPKKGKRTEEETQPEHATGFGMMQRFRAGCEGSISVLKRAFGMAKCYWRGFSAYAVRIGTSVFCHNLCVLFRLQPS
jgi:hypothetical protein